jgi:hypothetical protein
VTAREVARSVAHYLGLSGPLGPVTGPLFVVSCCLVLFIVLPTLFGLVAPAIRRLAHLAGWRWRLWSM